jgi:hypothetical protein
VWAYACTCMRLRAWSRTHVVASAAHLGRFVDTLCCAQGSVGAHWCACAWANEVVCMPVCTMRAASAVTPPRPSYIVPLFTAYADVCFSAFAGRVQHWTTFNEPHSFCLAVRCCVGRRGASMGHAGTALACWPREPLRAPCFCSESHPLPLPL